MSESGNGRDVTRRDALKLASGAVALGAALGIPRAALALSAEGGAAYEFYLKIYKLDATVPLQSLSISEDVARLMAENPGTIRMKFFRTAKEELGTITLPAEVQARLRNPMHKDSR